MATSILLSRSQFVISHSDSTLQNYSRDWPPAFQLRFLNGIFPTLIAWIIKFEFYMWAFFPQNDFFFFVDGTSLLRCFLVCVTGTSRDPCSSSHPAVCYTNTLGSMVCGNAHAVREGAAILCNTFFFFKELGRRAWLCQEYTAILAVFTLSCVAVVAGGTSCIWLTAVCTVYIHESKEYPKQPSSVYDKFLLSGLPFQ